MMTMKVKISAVVALYISCLTLNEKFQNVSGGECKGRGHHKHKHQGLYEVRCKDGEVVGKILKKPEVVASIVDEIWKSDNADNPSNFGDVLDDGGLHVHTDEWYKKDNKGGLRGSINNGTIKESELSEEETTKLNSPCKYDYIYNRLSEGARTPIVEYEKPTYLDEDELECPDFLCDKNYPLDRVVQFYYPDEEANQFRAQYRNFGRSLVSLVKESSGAKVELYAVSCCANFDFCLDNNVTAYPMFKLMRKGMDFRTGYGAVFSDNAFNGGSSLMAVEGVYKLLFPKA